MAEAEWAEDRDGAEAERAEDGWAGGWMEAEDWMG